ncbi:hypothetical protein KI387_042001, partial [Taxus chinensis]
GEVNDPSKLVESFVPFGNELVVELVLEVGGLTPRPEEKEESSHGMEPPTADVAKISNLLKAGGDRALSFPKNVDKTPLKDNSNFMPPILNENSMTKNGRKIDRFEETIPTEVNIKDYILEQTNKDMEGMKMKVGPSLKHGNNIKEISMNIDKVASSASKGVKE